MSIFILAIIATTLITAVVISLIVWLVKAIGRWKAKAHEAGYAGLFDYLRATPQTEQEKKDAVDLALKGLILCFIGIIFPPLMLIGAFPLYYGARKVAYSSFGLGIFDEPDGIAG